MVSPIEPNNVISILISSDFLKMDSLVSFKFSMKGVNDASQKNLLNSHRKLCNSQYDCYLILKSKSCSG